MFVAGHGKIGNYTDMIDAKIFVDELINDCINIKHENNIDIDQITKIYKQKYSGWRKIEAIESTIQDVIGRL